MHCPNFNGRVLKNKVDKPQNILIRARCKSWACDYCAKKNKEIWRASLIDQFNHNDNLRNLQWSFVTITVPDWVHRLPDRTARAEQSAKIIKGNWNALMMAIKKHIVAKFEYIRVIESHKSGALHVHMLMSSHWNDIIYRESDNEPYTKWLSDTAKKHDFGYIVSVRNLDVEGEGEAVNTFSALLYCLKYVTKVSETAASLIKINRIRYIQTSRQIKSPETIRKQNSSGSNWIMALPISIGEYEYDKKTGRWWIDGDKQIAIRVADFVDGMYPEIEE